MRALVLAHCEGAGWLDGDAPLAEGRVRPGLNPRLEGDGGEWAAFYKLLYTRRELHAFNQHPRLLAAAQALIGAAVLAQPRWIVRTMFPGSAAFTTPPHQDVFYTSAARTRPGPRGSRSGTARRSSAAWWWLPAAIAVARCRCTRPRRAGGHAVDAEPDLDWVGGALAARRCAAVP